jgi:hypothetical protein
MKTLSTPPRLILVAVILCSIVAYASSPIWPIRRTIDLSSGFGDFREGRFHAGIDIRTGGRTGQRLLAPVDGYVYRLKMSYRGSGKALYLMGDDNHIYVFYHLAALNEEIDRVVKRAQLSVQRYYIDIYLPRDSLRVKQGDILGLTGQTGTGAPHLHFEKRTVDNKPINPLVNGFPITDTVSPTINYVGFEMTDDRSLFSNGERQVFLSPVITDVPGEYALEYTQYITHPFGLLVDGWDKMRPGGMKQSIYKLTAYLDDKPIYESKFDTLDFDSDPSVRAEYDYPVTVDSGMQVRRLFTKMGNEFPGSRALNRYGGVVGADESLHYGAHVMRVVAEDCFGNTMSVRINFVWGPDQRLFVNDSIVNDTLGEKEYRTSLYFTPVHSYPELAIDSVFLVAQRGTKWVPTADAVTHQLDNGRVRIDVPVRRMIYTIPFALAVQSSLGPIIIDKPFSGIRSRAGKDVKMELRPREDGLIVHLGTKAKVASQAQLVLYYRDSLLGRELPPRYYNRDNYYFFIPAQKRYSRVDRIDVIWSEDTLIRPAHSEVVHLAAVGFKDVDTVDFDSTLFVEIGRDDLFAPIFVNIKQIRVVGASAFGLASALYEVLPTTFPVRKPFIIRGRLPQATTLEDYIGLCWLDEDKDKWVWLDDNKFADGFFRASSIGGGRFGLVADGDPPVIDRMNLIPKRTVLTSRPLIEFRLIDSLSGFLDDRNIDIRIDKKWMIPEYDPESKWCRTQPVEPLEDGEHHLAIVVTDQSGRRTEQYVLFYVKDSERAKSRR